MNVTGGSNLDSVVLCPLDGRRSSKEVYLRFFIVTFSTVAFYLHFAQRRDGTYIGWSAILFLLAPLNLVFRYSLGLLGIFGFYGIRIVESHLRFKHQFVSRETLTTPLRWLFGKARVDDYGLLPTSDTEEDETTMRSPLSVSGTTGKALISLAFLTQCAGSIFLYSRRWQHHAVTLFDQKVFEAAIGGLVVCLLNTGRVLSPSIFDNFVPSNSNKTKIDRFALFCRDSCRQSLLAFDEEAPHWLRLFKNIMIASLISAISMNANLFLAFDVYQDLFLNPKSGAIWISVVFVGIIPFVMGSFLTYNIYNDEKKYGRSKLLTKYPMLMLIYCLTVGVLMVVWAAMVMAMLVCVFYVAYEWTLSYVAAYRQIVELSTTPQNVTCPLLWSDPVSQWIWALA